MPFPGPSLDRMRLGVTAAATVSGAALLVLLTGCGASQPGREPGPAATVTETVTATATVTETPDQPLQIPRNKEELQMCLRSKMPTLLAGVRIINGGKNPTAAQIKKAEADAEFQCLTYGF